MLARAAPAKAPLMLAVANTSWRHLTRGLLARYWPVGQEVISTNSSLLSLAGYGSVALDEEVQSLFDKLGDGQFKARLGRFPGAEGRVMLGLPQVSN